MPAIRENPTIPLKSAPARKPSAANLRPDLLEGLRRSIRRYRKANGLTLESLGRIINKSKPTVWKYENGAIDMDILTLAEIASALNVSLTHLISAAIAEADGERPSESADVARAAGSRRNAENIAGPGQSSHADSIKYIYMYFYDGRTRKLARSRIDIDPAGIGESLFHAALFYDADSFKTPEKCRDFYAGTAYVADPYTNFSFQNVNNPVENLFIVAKEPFKKHGVMNGILTGISYKDFQPISFKVILSDYKLKEDDALTDWLKINKENLATIRRNNVFVLSEDYDNFTRV
jgi:transcriptional regulator with XRE-family HTH domain